MNNATVITEFFKWVLVEGVSHGFLHFIGWFLLVVALCRLPRLVWVDLSRKASSPSPPKAKDSAQ